MGIILGEYSELKTYTLKKRQSIAELRRKRIKERKKKLVIAIIAGVFAGLIFLNVKGTGKVTLYSFFKQDQVRVTQLMEANRADLKESFFRQFVT
jgi:hypothetical protein